MFNSNFYTYNSYREYLKVQIIFTAYKLIVNYFSYVPKARPYDFSFYYWTRIQKK